MTTKQTVRCTNRSRDANGVSGDGYSAARIKHFFFITETCNIISSTPFDEYACKRIYVIISGLRELDGLFCLLSLLMLNGPSQKTQSCRDVVLFSSFESVVSLAKGNNTMLQMSLELMSLRPTRLTPLRSPVYCICTIHI